MNVNERIKDLMESRNLGQNEIARRSGVPQPTIKRIIDGESRDPRLSNLVKISQALNVSLAELLGLEALEESSVVELRSSIIDTITELKLGGSLDEMSVEDLSEFIVVSYFRRDGESFTTALMRLRRLIDASEKKSIPG